nr:protein DpdF [Rubellimicrobium roseum]
MRELASHEAFDALARLLAGTVTDNWRAVGEPSVERLRSALTVAKPQPSALDLAVLLRQVLRREYARRERRADPSVHVAHPRLAGFRDWSRVGLAATPERHGWRVSARSWSPEWLPGLQGRGVDDDAASEDQRRAFGGEGCQGDPFLAAVGRDTYRSRGQRAAVRAALSTPPGATLVIALPTGEGKSLIFQLVHAVGFVGDAALTESGVSLVIVPTVALGVNHEEEAVTVCGLAPPLAYQGGSDAANATIAERIAAGTQGLCFASPEAACGPLRSALRRAAETGRLRALVVDEAHLVDQWGTDFRTEFQELSGLRRELLSLAPSDRMPRTLLLSATLTDASLETLNALFGAEQNFGSVAAVRLRPEPDYWVAPCQQEGQVERVLEAMHHVPRPAVLYVTRVEDAEAWQGRLRAVGFSRVQMLHGKTPREARERIVAQWREGLLDIVVGTSAFGLGIDYAHARSVVHACVPETLDRFYQEVGRGGRDGRASLSLIVPTPSDLGTAEALNQQKLISVDRGLERWAALFAGKQVLSDGRIAVRVDGSPGTTEDDIDMNGQRNADWNLRTLALMARSGLIRLEGAPRPPLAERGDWIAVEICEESHLARTVWEEKVERARREARDARERNLRLMRRFLAADECPATILEDLYGREGVARACSRCATCRSDPSRRRPESPLGEPSAPWRLPLPPLLARLLDADRRLLVLYPANEAGPAASRRLGDSLERMHRMGLAKVVLLGEAPFEMDRVLRFAASRPVFVSRLPNLAHSRLPAGPELVIAGLSATLSTSSLAPDPDRARVILAPDGIASPSGHPLREVFGGRILTIDEFHARIAE